MAEKKMGHNGTIQPEVYSQLLADAVALSKEPHIHNLNHAMAKVFGEFWREWRALSAKS